MFTHGDDTVTVVDHDITLDDVVTACTGFLHRTGWADSFKPDELAELAGDIAAEATEAAAQYPIGMLPVDPHTFRVGGCRVRAGVRAGLW